jgi:type I restriction enzyme S subunit
MTFEAKRLGDIAEIIGGGTPSTKDAGNWDGDIPWLTPKDLSSFEGIYVDRGTRSITEQGFKSSSAKMLPAGAVLYTSRAPIGYVAIASNAISTNQGFKSLILKDGYVPEFVFYLLKASKSEIESYASGGTFAEISAKALSEVVLQFPPKVQQEAIAKLLKSLDEKIATNNAISKTLEDIAQTIFKSWFIDFDPVKAKMAGEKPVGMDAATAALFPDSMEESELGLVPKGWDVKPAADLFQVGIGRTPPRKEPQWFCQGTEGIPWVSIRDMGTFETYSHGTNEGLTQAAVDKFKVPVVPENTVLMSFKLTVGKLCISDTDLVTNEAIAHFKISEDSPLNTLYTYLWLSNLDMGSLDSTSSIGTATNSGVIKQIKFLVPPQELLGIFHNKVSPIFSQLKLLRKQTTNLVLLRDSLLPRLISGELQIPEEMLVL